MTKNKNTENNNTDRDTDVDMTTTEDKGKTVVETQVLQLINDKKIKVRPKWHFFVNEVIFWTLCVSLVVLASLAFSVFIYTLFDSKDAVLEQSGGAFNYLIYFIDLIFWIIIFLAIAVLAYHDFIKTKYGYRHFFKVTNTVIVAYILFGIIFYFGNTYEYVDKFFINKVPYYHEVSNTKLSAWSRSEEGFLGGEILKVEGAKACMNRGTVSNTSTTKITLIDFHGDVWSVWSDDARWNTEDCLKFADKIRVSGSVGEGGVFKAEEIWGW